MLEVNDIDVFYGRVQCLWKVSLRVDKGEIVSVIGPNGAGKTTLLKSVSGLLHPSAGRINFLDTRIDRMPPHKIVEEGISLIPEDRKIFHHLTVRENLMMGACLVKDRKRQEEALGRVYGIFPVLKEREKQVSGTLSGGEQQMLAIARGLMSSPRLLMFDEPSRGLAPKLATEIFKSVREFRRLGYTILLVEQHVEQSLKIADRAYLTERGRITLHGNAMELLNNEVVRKAYL